MTARCREEINRLVTDLLSDMLLTTEENAFANLVREGIDRAGSHSSAM